MIEQKKRRIYEAIAEGETFPERLGKKLKKYVREICDKREGVPFSIVDADLTSFLTEVSKEENVCFHDTQMAFISFLDNNYTQLIKYYSKNKDLNY